MSDLRTIEIDFELYKMIEMARQSFEEPSYEILKRLIKGGHQMPKLPEPAPPPPPPSPEKKGRPWSRKGVVLPPGTQLRMEYNSHVHYGEVVDGQWLVEGTFYNSPSGAGMAIGKTKSGNPLPSLDGWLYWQAKTPGSSRWVSLKSLRDQAARQLI